MKDRLPKFSRVLAAIMILAVAGCDKPEVVPVTPDVPQEKVPLGTYTYDGREFPVHSVMLTGDESQVFFKISPIEDGQPQSTYAVVGINASLEGVEIDVARAWHNDDYYFIYEDPIMYYSQYRQLSSGTIFVKRSGNDPLECQVKVNIVLPDGKVFSFEQK